LLSGTFREVEMPRPFGISLVNFRNAAHPWLLTSLVGWR
jgi:hypothetical protein